jgi:hypothetical protein
MSLLWNTIYTNIHKLSLSNLVLRKKKKHVHTSILKIHTNTLWYYPAPREVILTIAHLVTVCQVIQGVTTIGGWAVVICGGEAH